MVDFITCALMIIRKPPTNVPNPARMAIKELPPQRGGAWLSVIKITTTPTVTKTQTKNEISEHILFVAPYLVLLLTFIAEVTLSFLPYVSLRKKKSLISIKPRSAINDF
jgi:hypothetical protein